MTPGAPIAQELKTAFTPEEMVGYVVQQSGRLRSLGYKIEQHTPTVAVLARRYTPTVAWALPLGIGALVFLIGVAGPSATNETAESAGTVLLIALIAAFVLSLIAKSTDRVTISASPDGEDTRVIISGSATPRLREYIATWDEQKAGK